ncbi:YcaO-like family protein [Clostridium oceanicum]|uniref:YcaO-like family protein n=1 Tax=Clostridium oceanicum TaxID=1543 RepID=A0ABN1J8P5_9CLOT
MIQFYPSFNNVLDNFHSLAGNQTGIMKSVIMPLVNIESDVNLKSMTGTMPNYHKQLFKEDVNVQYHIIGYGSYYEEALIKYTGESIERYSTVVTPKMVEDKIVYATYREISKLGKTMPLKFMDVFTKEQLEENSKYNKEFSDKKVTEDDVIGWIKCPSLFNPKEDIYVPAKMMFVGYTANEKKGEKAYIHSFSTGTASHKSLKKALLNALVEYVQIDAMMINWYTNRKAPKVIIDDPRVKNILQSVGLGEDSVYEIIPLYISLKDLPLPIFSIFLRRKDKKMPYLLYGVQGDFDVYNGVLRGIMEGASISYSSYFNAVYNTDAIKKAVKEDVKFLDLDSNVMFYAANNKIEKKDDLVNSFIDGEINLSEVPTIENLSVDSQIENLIKYLKKVSEYAVYLDITPPESREKGWYVMRVLIPEILEMCIPDFPFKNHPRIVKHGGVTNGYPHPMP